MVHNSKVGKSSTSPAKLTSRLFLIIAVFYTVHNLFIADPNIFDVISMKREIRKISEEVELLKAKKENLRKELRNLDEEIRILRKEMGSFDEGEYIIIYKE